MKKTISIILSFLMCFIIVFVWADPFEDAMEGDYSVGVKVEGEKVSKPIDFRVTVHGSRALSWIGIAAIVLVVLGLTGLFRWFGRR